MDSRTQLVEWMQLATPARDSDSQARRLQQFFVDALATNENGGKAASYGSLSRGTHVDPIRDVDVLLVFDPALRPDWGGGDGKSPDQALAEVERMVADAAEMTIWQGSTQLGDHSVKHFPAHTGTGFSAFVDIVPALPTGTGTLLIPNRAEARWLETDPGALRRRVRRRQSNWNDFIPLVRLLKAWNAAGGGVMKSLTIEVLAIELLPRAPASEALASFFSSASARIAEPVLDPSGLCGAVDPDLDIDRARQLLDEAAHQTGRAVATSDADEAAGIWRKVFDRLQQPSHDRIDGIAA